MTLAEMKRRLAGGATLRLVRFESQTAGEWHEYDHKYLGVTRTVEKLQSESVRLEGGSWLTFDKAATWQYRETPEGVEAVHTVTGQGFGTRLTYMLA